MRTSVLFGAKNLGVSEKCEIYGVSARTRLSRCRHLADKGSQFCAGVFYDVHDFSAPLSLQVTFGAGRFLLQPLKKIIEI